ncbi:hypothetical protein Pan44_02350 [Caulifigura coniformis]|uniref:Nickel uptake substrate-specific transmembrane region n=1 Tax=Caulifigura coniformis TaxID=2527983 RepID=A0A517S7X7_9PLAN|nr:carboxypeptidase-like regulatory domain-containing protein [Caulifigura coniformis]QDT52226.1 hypothetical protein Pan44_02350 [Caulifigura coniformis]
MVEKYVIRSRRNWLLSSLALALLAGCDNGPVVSSVKGTVSLDGRPLPNATLVFTPEAGGRSSLGRTDDNGLYNLLFTPGKEGALVGDMRVRITVAEEYQDSRDRTHIRPEKVPAKYNEKSELVVTVEPKDNVIDFDLQSK